MNSLTSPRHDSSSAISCRFFLGQVAEVCKVFPDSTNSRKYASSTESISRVGLKTQAGSMPRFRFCCSVKSVRSVYSSTSLHSR